MIKRLAALAGSAAVVITTAVALSGSAYAAQPPQDCDEARPAYDAVVERLNERASELGVNQADIDRLRAAVEEAGKDGLIDDQESADLLDDPVVVRIQASIRPGDLDLLKDVAAKHNALLRCDDVDKETPAAGTPTAEQPTTTPKAPPAQAPGGDRDCDDYVSQAAAQDRLRDDPADPFDLDVNGNGLACEEYPYENTDRDLKPVKVIDVEVDVDVDDADAPRGGVATGFGGMADEYVA